MITNLCNSDTVSRDFTDAMAAIHSDRVACVPGSFNNRALVRIPLDSSRVNLIVSAGGFGAPFPDSMVTCDGMADASVIGGKFAAPSAYDIYEAAKYINSDKGYLLIYNNFMGDCLNNDLAKELMEIDGLKSTHMTRRQITNVNIVADTRSIMSIVIVSENAQFLTDTHSRLRNVRHQVIGNAVRIFTNASTRMSANRVKVTEQDNIPLGVCLLHIHQDLFQH